MRERAAEHYAAVVDLLTAKLGIAMGLSHDQRGAVLPRDS